LEGTSRGVGSVEGVVCYNPEEAERQKQHREQVRKELEAESDGLRTPRGPSHSKRINVMIDEDTWGFLGKVPSGERSRAINEALRAWVTRR
jgi:hypothetical protein